jgi:enoyl-CoA hydratase/carnithine racemase
VARTVGLPTALALAADGRLLTPDEARRLGLVDALVAPDRLLESARELAERIARRPPATIGAIKRNLYDGVTRPLSRAIAIEQATYASIAAQRAAILAGDELARQIAAIEPPGAYRAEEIWADWHRGTRLDMVDPPAG